MRAEALAHQIAADIKAGLIPCFVCATVGTTSSNAIDPVREIARICRDHNLWLHVDSAMSGTAALCPEFRFIHDGVEFADSYTFNPHKWMFTNFDCNLLLRRRPQAPDPDALRFCPSTCATRRRNPAPSLIIATGTSSSGGVFARSSFGS